MSGYVTVEIPVRRDVAELLRDRQPASRVARLVSEMLRPTSPASDPLTALLAAVKHEAHADGLTDAEIDAELAHAKVTRRRQTENRAAMDAWNSYVEQQGLPLAQFRQF